WAMRAAGYISVEREDKKKAYQAFMEAIEKIKAGFSVVIFPEGTRSEDGQVAPFKKGSHLLALRSGTAMSPVTIVGSGKIIKKGSGAVHPGSIRIVISPPVKPDKSHSRDEADILEQIRITIRNNLESASAGAQTAV
ncbi:MAG: 1-acyl-sn-glycerol-3-phosphate acyltransferase, partial [Nitrospinae bacterium]|nr:1-acyl-sn-glycerol-3-phosphate acyltransferase [Nitrospinota bacterium]